MLFYAAYLARPLHMTGTLAAGALGCSFRFVLAGKRYCMLMILAVGNCQSWGFVVSVHSGTMLLQQCCGRNARTSSVELEF